MTIRSFSFPRESAVGRSLPPAETPARETVVEEHSAPPAALSNLPVEMLLTIAGKLDTRDFLNFSQVDQHTQTALMQSPEHRQQEQGYGEDICRRAEAATSFEHLAAVIPRALAFLQRTSAALPREQIDQNVCDHLVAALGNVAIPTIATSERRTTEVALDVALSKLRAHLQQASPSGTGNIAIVDRYRRELTASVNRAMRLESLVNPAALRSAARPIFPEQLNAASGS